MSSILSTYTGVVAAGTTQATATSVPLSGYIEVGTCTSSANGIILPKPVNGVVVRVGNKGAYPLSVYPTGNASFDSLAAAAPAIVPMGGYAEYVSKDGYVWSTVTSSGSSVVAGGATRTLTAADAGIIYVSAAAARVYTMPAVAAAAGLTFKFKIQVGGANTVTIACPAGTLQGQVNVGAAGAVSNVQASANANAILAVSQTVGSHVELESDGTYYYISGQSGIAAGISFT